MFLLGDLLEGGLFLTRPLRCLHFVRVQARVSESSLRFRENSIVQSINPISINIHAPGELVRPAKTHVALRKI